MASRRSRIIAAALRDFFSSNAKIVVGVAAVFILSLILGVTLAYRAVGGEFETVARVDAETGAGKVFFLSLLSLAACYGVILLSGANGKTVFLACIPFAVLGFVCGRFSTALICRYEAFGLLNFLLIYLPFFILTAALFTVGAAIASNSSNCECAGGSKLKPSFVALLKVFLLNVATAFALFIVVGSISGGVIIVKLF